MKTKWFCFSGLLLFLFGRGCLVHDFCIRGSTVLCRFPDYTLSSRNSLWGASGDVCDSESTPTIILQCVTLSFALR